MVRTVAAAMAVVTVAALLHGCASPFEGMGSRDYTASMDELHRAARTALARLGATVDSDETFTAERERWIYAHVADRSVSLRIVRLTPGATQLNVVANARSQAWDQATAAEILAQTEQALDAQHADKAAHAPKRSDVH